MEEAPATIRARKVVVVSAGALSTPLILQRSGVGCRSHLKSVGLNHVVSDLQVMGNQWDRTMRRRGGDFSVALANYYPASRRYALAWAVYRLGHQDWGNRNLNGAILLESGLGPTTLSKIVLPNNRNIQEYLPLSPVFDLNNANFS